jgi:hypothetical protein
LFFRIEKNHPGIVFARDYASSDEIAINIMKSGTRQNLQLADWLLPPLKLVAMI